MKTQVKEPLILKNRWAVPGLIITFALFGLVSFIGQRILSASVMKNQMDIDVFQRAIYNFNLVLGIIISIALAFFFAAAIRGSVGGRRAGFIIGLFSAAGPVFGALSTTILFKILQLPSMGAGSVIASAASALLLILPCFIMFLVFVFSRKLKLASRLLVLVVAIVSLLVAIFPTVITVLALVVMPNNPMMGPLMNLSSYLIHARGLLVALGFAIVYFMNPVPKTSTSSAS